MKLQIELWLQYVSFKLVLKRNKESISLYQCFPNWVSRHTSHFSIENLQFNMFSVTRKLKFCSRCVVKKKSLGNTALYEFVQNCPKVKNQSCVPIKKNTRLFLLSHYQPSCLSCTQLKQLNLFWKSCSLKYNKEDKFYFQKLLHFRNEWHQKDPNWKHVVGIFPDMNAHSEFNFDVQVQVDSSVFYFGHKRWKICVFRVDCETSNLSNKMFVNCREFSKICIVLLCN